MSSSADHTLREGRAGKATRPESRGSRPEIEYLGLSAARARNGLAVGSSSFVGAILGGLTVVVLIARLLAGVDGLLEQTALDGLDYLPPWWLASLVVPVVLLCLWVGRRGTAALLAALFIVLLGAEDDWHWQWHRTGLVSAEEPAFTVLALNVRYYRAGRAEVVEGIKSLNPDVVLLSEDRLGGGGREELQRAFAPYTFYSGRSDEAAIASRLPILDVEEVDLPTRAPTLHRPNRLEEQIDHPPRSFMHARLDLNGIPVNIISVRFIGGRPASDALRDQLEWGRYLLGAQSDELHFLLDYVSRLKGGVILGGDLNALPTARIIRQLDTVASDAYLANHWVGMPTFPTKLPVERLDYLFSMNGVLATDAERPDLRVSDHYPVFARFVLASS